MSGPVAVGREVAAAGLWEAVDVYRAVLAAASVAEMTGCGAAAYYLRVAALEAVISDRIQTRLTISVHQALMAGADVSEIAGATGMSARRVADQWRAWARAQRQLRARTGTLGLSEDDYARAAAGLRDLVEDAVGGVVGPRGTSQARTDK